MPKKKGEGSVFGKGERKSAASVGKTQNSDKGEEKEKTKRKQLRGEKKGVDAAGCKKIKKNSPKEEREEKKKGLALEKATFLCTFIEGEEWRESPLLQKKKGGEEFVSPARLNKKKGKQKENGE